MEEVVVSEEVAVTEEEVDLEDTGVSEEEEEIEDSDTGNLLIKKMMCLLVTIGNSFPECFWRSRWTARNLGGLRLSCTIR